MEVKESYRILELEIGASRAEVDAAYFRLIERWHPDRAAPGGPEAVREAERRVQAITEAHQTLSKIASSVTRPPMPVPPTTNAAPPHPTTTAAIPSSVTTPPTGMKPRLAPLSVGQPDLSRPPPKPPPPETWAARSTPAPSLTSPPIPVPPPATPPTKIAAPTAPRPATPSASSLTTPPVRPSTTPPLTPPAGGAPPSAPTPDPVSFVTAAAEAPPSSISTGIIKVVASYDRLFPVDSPRRRFGPYIIVAALLLVLLLGRCAFSSSGSKRNREPDPKTTGRLVVKSNLASASVEATRIPTADDATTARFGGALNQALAGLPPGKYSVTARSEGWPDIHDEVNVEAGHATEIAMDFKGGSLRLDSDPTGAAVHQGEAVLGRTPLVLPQLPPGDCQLSLEYPSWPWLSFKATIVAGEEATATVRLPHGKLTVETTPPGTTVLLGGRTLGQTPLTVDPIPAGIKKLTLQAKDFPPLELSVTVEDGGDVKVHPALGSSFPVLDPAALFRDVWVADNPDSIAAPFEGLSGPSKPQNGVIRNLNRKRLYEHWLRNRYCFTAVVKSYDKASGQIEFAEQPTEYSHFRVLATLSSGAHNDPDLTAQLVKGATFAFYGRLGAVEEPRWTSKVITFEFTSVEPLR